MFLGANFRYLLALIIFHQVEGTAAGGKVIVLGTWVIPAHYATADLAGVILVVFGVVAGMRVAV